MNFISDRITIDERLCNGKPTVRGMRITVQSILEFLYAGDSPKEILKQFPMLEPLDIDACQKFAIELMKRGYVIQKTDLAA